MATFTDTWNLANRQSPADTDNASAGASKIRAFKVDFDERMQIDHSMAGDADDGKHLKVTLIEGSDPTVEANNGYVYSKDASGTTELYYRDSDSNIVQLTNAGEINSGVGKGSADTMSNVAIAATVASAALTVALKTQDGGDPASTDIAQIGFQKKTQTDGTYEVIDFTAAISVIAPQGATLGFAAAATGFVHVYMLYDSGDTTKHLAISGQQMPDDRNVYTTVAISATADSQNVLYSTTQKTDLPGRYLGRFKIAMGAVAGDWDNAPTEITPTSNPAPVGRRVEVFTADGTFIVPQGVTEIEAELWGGGASGGGGGGSSHGCGGGGGGYCHGIVSVTTGESVTVTVGVGGAARSINNTGLAGGNTTVKGLTANGGAAGAGANGSGNGSNGGSASGGDINLTGQRGATYSEGGQLGRSGGGSPRGGDGSRVDSSHVNGTSGSVPGGGSSGGSLNGVGSSSGAGADGLVIIRW